MLTGSVVAVRGDFVVDVYGMDVDFRSDLGFARKKAREAAGELLLFVIGDISGVIAVVAIITILIRMFPRKT